MKRQYVAYVNGYEFTVRQLQKKKKPCLIVRTPYEDNVWHKVAEFDSEDVAQWFCACLRDMTTDAGFEDIQPS